MIGSNYLSDMFSKWHIHHFRDTSVIAEEENGSIVGFVMGFLWQTGRVLYEESSKTVGMLGRNVIR
ncbi:hypothetical protein A8708_16545 [Paenibacillus oryzisoli]|uniref:Uncharacterized protein n=1 Tax=Paenibacillus oryzisoli TaxID=1850517 RepID=A0A198AJX1_9BACL|nr:hypothetical protein A8708_16545 [Paenibacillus oryzisoli]